MTIIAAAIGPKGAAIASDSFGISEIIAVDYGSKIIQLTEDVYTGFAGPYIIEQWLRRELGRILTATEAPHWSEKDWRIFIEDAWAGWRNSMREDGNGRVDQEGSMCLPCVALIVWPGGIFELGVDGAVLRPTDNCTAIGGGTELALGAMYALSKQAPVTRVRVAIEAAMKYSLACGGRIHIIRIPKPRKEVL